MTTHNSPASSHTFGCGHPCPGDKFLCPFEPQHSYECDDCFAVSQQRLAAVEHDPATDFEDGYGGRGIVVDESPAQLAAGRRAEAMHDSDDAQFAGF